MSAQVIGYLGENGVRDVRIPIGHLLDKWQGLRPLLVMVPVGGSDDEAYPVQYTLDGTDLVWHVSDADTAVAGTTKAAVRMVDDGGRVGMDEPFQVIISPNLSAGGEPPVVIKPWVDKLATLVPRAESAAERAESATERAESAAERVETGTAPNALALGDKPPEYYLPVVQLLDNACWKYPEKIINQRGIKSGDVIPIWSYFFDRWKSRSGQLTVTFDDNDGVIANGLDGYFYQITERKYSGESYTAAVAFADGEILICSGNDQSYAGSPILLATAGNITGEMVHIYRDTAERIETMFFTGSRRVLWLLLTPGIYTADTLPPFVPKGYAVELAECRRYYRKRLMEAVMIAYSTMSAAIAVPREEMRIPNVTVKLIEAKMLVDYDFVDILYLSNMIATDRNGSLKFLFENGTDAPFVANRAYLARIEFEEIADL